MRIIIAIKHWIHKRSISESPKPLIKRSLRRVKEFPKQTHEETQ